MFMVCHELLEMLFYIKILPYEFSISISFNRILDVKHWKFTPWLSLRLSSFHLHSLMPVITSEERASRNRVCLRFCSLKKVREIWNLKISLKSIPLITLTCSCWLLVATEAISFPLLNGNDGIRRKRRTGSRKPLMKPAKVEKRERNRNKHTWN